MKNERIAVFIISIATFTQMSLFTIFSILNDIWDVSNLDLLAGRIVIAIVINIIGSGLIYFLFSIIYRFFWKEIKCPHLDINGLWYSLKIDPNKTNHIRIGTVKITQKYFYIHIDGETHNVAYSRATETLTEDINNQATHWEENCTLSENGILRGIFVANCSDGSTRNGTHFYMLQKNKKIKPHHIEGWFIDILDNPNQFETADPRKGKILLYRDEFSRDARAKEICSEHVDAQGMYRTPARNLT